MPPAPASAVLRLSTATRPSSPPSIFLTHFQSAVHVYPLWHSSWGEHTLQSRFMQESANAAGRTSASTLEHKTRRFLMCGILGYGLKELPGKWTEDRLGVNRQDFDRDFPVLSGASWLRSPAT